MHIVIVILRSDGGTPQNLIVLFSQEDKRGDALIVFKLGI